MGVKRPYKRTIGQPLTRDEEDVKLYKRAAKEARMLSDGFYKEKIFIQLKQYKSQNLLAMIMDVLTVNGYSFRYENLGDPDERLEFKLEKISHKAMWG